MLNFLWNEIFTPRKKLIFLLKYFENLTNLSISQYLKTIKNNSIWIFSPKIAFHDCLCFSDFRGLKNRFSDYNRTVIEYLFEGFWSWQLIKNSSLYLGFCSDIGQPLMDFPSILGQLDEGHGQEGDSQHVCVCQWSVFFTKIHLIDQRSLDNKVCITKDTLSEERIPIDNNKK